MAILRDMTGGGNKTRGERYFIRTCKYCLDYKGAPKPIMPDDMLMRRESDGSYRCGVCVSEQVENAILKSDPASEKARNIMQRRQREKSIDRLNKFLYQNTRKKNNS